MRSFIAIVVTACLATTASVSFAQTTEEELRTLIADDLTALGVNLPVWMSQHITSVMAPVGIGAGSGISDDSGGFSVGILTRLGLFNNFDDVGHGLQLVDLQPGMPSLLPWPQLGVCVGVNLGNGFELGGDLQFIPDMDIAADDLRLKASLIAGAATVRWRLNKPKAAIPALILGVGGAYYAGTFEIGGGFDEPYSEVIEGQTVTGRVSVDTAPSVSWSVFQVSPEVRAAWDFGGLIRPYVGFGVGFSFGEVADELTVRAKATIETIDGQPYNQVVTYEDDLVLFETEPALWTLRPHIGFDLLLPPLAFTAQLDLAVVGKGEIGEDIADGAGSFDSDDTNYLYNENSRSSQTQASLVATFALRVQF